ncbi:MAG: P1 family peptidase [Actinomycetes bacterium]
MISGFRIGHATADGDGWLTGTTVVVAEGGAVGGVDVRGGGPGTRETDLLDPVATLERVDAVVLSGGSAYGLAAADGVMLALEQDKQGFPVGPEPGQVVPLVPAAVLFDLGRGGSFAARPGPQLGAAAYLAARSEDPERGCVGAGTGAVCGALKGGFGYAETRLPSGIAVAAAVAVNAAGSAVDPASGRLWADRRRRLPRPSDAERAAVLEAREEGEPPLNTTIGVVLTDASLTKAQATKVASVAHDGLARAIAPVHSLYDGDTFFCLASGQRPARPSGTEVNAVLAAAADAVTNACLDALLSARLRGNWSGYADLVPSAGS